MSYLNICCLLQLFYKARTGSDLVLSDMASTRCPIARHHTVSARPRTLLVYEGNKSHVIKNMAATVKFFSPYKMTNQISVTIDLVSLWTTTVRCRAKRHRSVCTMWPDISSISFIVRCRAIGQPDKNMIAWIQICDYRQREDIHNILYIRLHIATQDMDRISYNSISLYFSLIAT